MNSNENEEPIGDDHQQPEAGLPVDGFELTTTPLVDDQPINPISDMLHDQTVVSGLYENYFLDYASYLILERAVPAVEDGLKPVQTRILRVISKYDCLSLRRMQFTTTKRQNGNYRTTGASASR